jgi:hypothetical protein
VKVKSRLLLAVVAGMLAASTVGVAAQDPESEASFFSVTMVPGDNTEGGPGDSGPGWEGYVGLEDEGVIVDAGDPRASGLLDQVRNGTDVELPDVSGGSEWGAAGLKIERSAVRLINDQGSWVGDGTITARFPDGPPSHVAARWRFEGEGAYQGLILEIHGEGLNDQMQSVVWGAIYPAEALPEAPEPIAE